MSLDLNTLKANVYQILSDANTTTASPDLSSGLNTRIQRVMKVNPGRIPIQPSYLPFVTCYIEGKSIELKDIAKTQTQGLRRCEIDMKIIGSVWNNILTNPDNDESDNDCESLMENIEQILRANPTLSGFATWSFPESVQYFNVDLDEGTHLRTGILALRVSVFY